jgi:hypothetical protein
VIICAVTQVQHERTVQVSYPAAASSVAAASAERLGQAIAKVLDDHDPPQDYGLLPHDARSLEAGGTRDGRAEPYLSM